MIARACVAAILGLGVAVTTPVRAADQALLEAARKEGSVTWYATQIVDQFARPAASAFEKKYGIRVNYVRADPADIVLRIAAEAKAGRVQADVFDGTSTAPSLKKEGFVLKWQPESAKRLPPEYVDREGFWVATNLYVLTPAYNTEMIRPGAAPASLDSLLAPEWKDKIAWSARPSASAGPGFIGLVLAVKGQEQGMDYLRQLAKQNVAGVDAAARQVLDQVIAGEYPLALATFNHHSEISAAKGAPVAWIPMNPAMAVLSVIGVTKTAPHPNAAKLFVEFLMSPEGQTLFREAGYIPVDPDVKLKDETLRPDGQRLKAIYFTPEEVEEAMPKWAEIQSQLFR